MASSTFLERASVARRPLVASLMCAGMALGACGKTEAGPAAPIAQVSRAEPAAPAQPAAPSAPDNARAPESPALRRGPADRTEAIQATLALMQQGDFGQAFKYLADPVLWTEVGLPDGELDSIGKIIDFQRNARAGFSDFHMKARRIIESADYQVVELVWSARHSGAFADGTAATDKVVTLPEAMLIRYQEDGLIDRVWVFQDWPNALQQLGLAPGLPSDFKPFMLPEKTEVVTGAFDPLLHKGYDDFVARLGGDAYSAMLTERAADDFSWLDLASGQAISGRDATASYLGARLKSFALTSTHIESAIGAGPYFAAYKTSELVYKGGFASVAASDQKITTHTLDIVLFDAATMRMQSLASYGNSYETLFALGIGGGGAAWPRLAVFGIDRCDSYVAKVRACTASLDGVPRQAMRDALDKQVAVWTNDVAPIGRAERLGQSCDAALVVAKATLAASCPRVAWN
ncbi:MAG: ester cyclase [Myxococcota bacterium]